MATSFRIVAVGQTDEGPSRDHNEDSFLVARELRLYVVADGMGGHEAGDVASRLAIDTIRSFYRGDRKVPSKIDKRTDLDADARTLLAAVHDANQAVVEKGGGEAAARHGGMGSTVVALQVPREGGMVHFCHVGDSRCYRYRRGELLLLTEDHTMVNDALRLNPDIDDEILEQLPRNVVTRALGLAAKVEPDVRSEPLEDGDLFLLCSDGLSGPVTGRAMARVLAEQGSDLGAACAELIAMANSVGDDNVTVVLVRCVAG
jgi:serine/threonine protein phosphatase PrpC